MAPISGAGLLGAAILAVPGLALLAQGWIGLRGYPLFAPFEIRVEPEPAPLGSQLTVEIDCLPLRPLEIARFAVHLRCHEKAIRREGSRDLAYVKKVFERTVLLAEKVSAGSGEKLAYQAKLRLPVDRAATFAALNHFVDWSIVLEVEANRLPAAVAQRPVRVLPELAS
jgi:hypothetical protein